MKTRPGIIDDYCHAVENEFILRKAELIGPIETIYIGGGTPTVIPVKSLTRFLSGIKEAVEAHNANYRKQEGADDYIKEFTVEANPEDISHGLLGRLQETGVNRISIGIQSFDDCQLKAVRRRHNSIASIEALTALRDSGINYSADLIYGLPGQSTGSWESQLNILMGFEPPHFSAYLLSFEPGTQLNFMKEKGSISETDDTTVNAMYKILTSTAGKHGYHHYEISNFSKPGQEAKHNSSYWDLTPYLGLGCGAHSFDGNIRRINPNNVAKYIASLTRDCPEPLAAIDAETRINKINDYIITSLRTSRGISTSFIREKWGEPAASIILQNLQRLSVNGQLITTEGHNYRIPENKWLTSDSVLREIILDDE